MANSENSNDKHLPDDNLTDNQKEYLRILEETMGQVKKDIIDHYDKVQSEIDLRTEKLLFSLPEALKNGREELLERVREEKEKSLAALAPDSPLVKYKNEYYQRFLQLKDEYKNCGSDQKKKEELITKVNDLKKKVQILEEFLDDFKNRTLCFEEADKSVYASLIGELVPNTEHQLDLEISSSSENLNSEIIKS